MGILEFLLISAAGAVLVIFFRVGLRDMGPRFLRSLLRRLFDLAVTAFVVSLALFLTTVILQWIYSGGITYETLQKVVGYQDQINSWLSYLPPPYVLAVTALVLVVATSFSSQERAGIVTSSASGVFLRFQPWINRLSIAAAILSSFTYLNSDGRGARLWLELQIADVKAGAVAVDDEIDNLAGTVSAYEFFDEIVNATSEQNWGQIVVTAKSLVDLEDAIKTRTVEYEGMTVKSAKSLLAREFRPDSSSLEDRFKVAEPKPTGEFSDAYRKFSSKTLAEFKDALSEIRSNLPMAGRGAQLQSEIRTAFVELAAKATVARTTTALAPTGNAIVDLLAEAATETAIERMRERAMQISESIKDALRRGGDGTRVDLRSWLRKFLDGSAKFAFGAVAPDDGRFSSIRAVQSEVGRLRIALNNERRGICPAGEVLLECNRNGVSFCGSPALDHTPC
ncbi:hypothetical protein [Rhizobium leguminosarum]